MAFRWRPITRCVVGSAVEGVLEQVALADNFVTCLSAD
jgi:hypothetical protein